MIHKFKQGDLYFVLDINSGAIHLVDHVIFDILDDYPSKTKEEVMSLLSEKYSDKMLEEAFEDIEYLVGQEQLFTEDKYIQALEVHPGEPVIKAMCLHVAHDCNIRCAYCFASQGDFEGDRSLMSLEVGKKAFDYLVAHSGNRRNLEVDFFGGEPLMNFDVVKELVAYGREIEKPHNKNFRFTFTTNGVLLNDEINAFVNEHMDNVVLSIDGRPEVNDKMRFTINDKGTYDTIVPKFKSLIETRGGKSYYVRGTFTRFNQDFSNDVLHLADLGFDSVSVEPVVAEAKHAYALRDEDVDYLCNQYEVLADEMIKREQEGKGFNFFHFALDLSQGPCIIKRLSGCGAGSEYIAVTPEGDVYPCHQFVGDEDFLLGSVVTNEVDHSKSSDFKKAHVYNKEKCKECWARFYCSGGCHANAYNFNNDIFVPYDLGCELEKKRIECAIYMHGKRLSGE